MCQAVGRLGCAAGPGSDFSEVLVVEVGLAALDCRVALMCPPGPANASLVVVDEPGIDDIGQVAFKGSTGFASGFCLRRVCAGRARVQDLGPRSG